MKRLADEIAPADAVTAAAARLARAAESSQLPAGLAQRVRAKVMTHEPARLAWRLQPTLVAVVLLGLVALAGATAARAWRDRQTDGPAPREPATAAPPPTEPPAMSRIAAHEVAAPLPQPATPAAPHAVAKPDKPRTEPSSAASLVVDATRALHYDHDPARARILLEKYLRSYPRGDLAEEAFALSIEASMLQDDPTAGVFGRAYLQRFPAGRFRAVAVRAAERFPE